MKSNVSFIRWYFKSNLTLYKKISMSNLLYVPSKLISAKTDYFIFILA